ncbi:hypothetical protein [Nesterenkonia sp. NBAIMH1]|nr:hypothetical protein [Nesterenkonia sp. NBAIMH1]
MDTFLTAWDVTLRWSLIAGPVFVMIAFALSGVHVFRERSRVYVSK